MAEIIPGKTMMKCGHTALTTKGCPICIGLVAGAEEVADELPDLTGRKARCECGGTRDSDISLPFFTHRPDCDTDSYYCGCRGWD